MLRTRNFAAVAAAAIVALLAGCEVDKLVTSSSHGDQDPPSGTPPAAFVARIVSGNGQSDTVAATLKAPYVVRVSDSRDNPVEGISVNWTVSGGGSLVLASARTSSAGTASALHKLGTTAGSQSVVVVVASAGGEPMTFSATARNATPSQMSFMQQPTNAQRNMAIDPAVSVMIRDNFGNAATNGAEVVSISLMPTSGGKAPRLRGRVSVDPSRGIGLFDDLRIDRDGAGFRLRARSGPMTATSQPFNINR